MIEGKRDVGTRADSDGVVDDLGALFDNADAEDTYLRLVDDGRSEEAAADAVIGDGECAALHLFRLQLLGARAGRKVVNGTRQTPQIQVLCVLDHRYDQAS